jgi:8-oxo-dGTP pyrophosphatase MutT (NUDIX family)
MLVTPHDAATVILLRPSLKKDGGSFEVLMVLRHPDSKFVPDSYVFPGGCLDQEDCLPEMENLCTGMTLKEAQAVFHDMSLKDKALGAWVAGIRETFEEVGLLLAYRSDNTLIAFDSEDVRQRFRAYRKKIQAGELTLKTILEHEGLTLAADRLHYFSHWITPELLSLRYDVRFFIAEAPPHQKAIHDGIELTRHVWLTPREILEGYNRHKFNMVVPTLVTIEELAHYKTVADAITATDKKEINAILTIMRKEKGELVEYMPDGRVFKNMPPSVL